MEEGRLHLHPATRPRLRYQLDRDGDAFKQIYATRTAAERPLAPRLRVLDTPAAEGGGQGAAQVQVSTVRPSPSALNIRSSEMARRLRASTP